MYVTMDVSMHVWTHVCRHDCMYVCVRDMPAWMGASMPAHAHKLYIHRQKYMRAGLHALMHFDNLQSASGHTLHHTLRGLGPFPAAKNPITKRLDNLLETSGEANHHRWFPVLCGSRFQVPPTNFSKHSQFIVNRWFFMLLLFRLSWESLRGTIPRFLGPANKQKPSTLGWSREWSNPWCQSTTEDSPVCLGRIDTLLWQWSMRPLWGLHRKVAVNLEDATPLLSMVYVSARKGPSNVHAYPKKLFRILKSGLGGQGPHQCHTSKAL